MLRGGRGKASQCPGQALSTTWRQYASRRPTAHGGGGRQLKIATAFFSLNALLLLADTLAQFEHVQILFGDDADAQQRGKLLEMLRRNSDEELRERRETDAQLSPLKKVEALFTSGRVEARCYTAKKFHAKAYLVLARTCIPPIWASFIQSGYQLLRADFERRWVPLASDADCAAISTLVQKCLDAKGGGPWEAEIDAWVAARSGL